jgi:uncharacterized membrane protein
MEDNVMETSKTKSNLINTIFKGVAVAMGIAVIVLNILKTAPADTQLMLLGLGLACLAISSLQRD